MLAAIGRAMLWGFLGALVAPVAMLAAELVVYRLSPRCGLPGDSGGCAIGIFAIVLASIPFGAGLFTLASLLHSGWCAARAAIRAGDRD